MPLHPLYAIADTAALAERLIPAAEAALRGGVRWLQYRDKSGDQARRLREATELRALCLHHGARLIINDDPALALRVQADGVHLGQTDGDPAEARQRLGSRAIIGVTCHDSIALAQHAKRAGASYVAFGRFFPSRTKPDAPPAPADLLTRARATVGLPIVAIGGITLENGASLLEAGADWLAVSHDLFSAPDIERRARTYLTLPCCREETAL